MLVINRDEWGGFYDTVPPPRAIAPNNVDTDLVDGGALLGCRVPVVVVSPFTRSSNPATPRIHSGLFDHTSVLKLIEWRFNLAPLTARDASDTIENLASAFDFNNPDSSVPALPVVRAPFPIPCGLFQLGSEVDNESYDFHRLLRSERTVGWRLARQIR